MPAGRPPKPVEQKRRAGNPGKRALPSPLAVVPAGSIVPDMPTVDAMEVVAEHARAWLAPSDQLAMAILRETVEERGEVRDRAMAGSFEARKELRQLDAQIISMLSALGFDPTARARLGLVEVKRVSKLDELRQRSQ